MITFDESTGVVSVVISVRGGKPDDLNRYVASGMLHTLNSIANEDQGPVRRRLIDCLVRQVRALRRNESELRSAKRRQREVV
ncbi:hypothetical protein [Stenotrophomonas maltophilia]